MSDQADKLRQLRLVPGARAADRPPRPRPRMHTIAIVSGKGGVGKSTIAANLALALARRQKRVLLLDGDLALANVDLLFGLVPKLNLGDVVFGQASIEDILITTPDGIQILPAASGVPELADLDDFRRESLLRELSHLEDRCDVLLLDTGSGLGRQTIHFARAADRVLVVTTPEPTAFSDAYATVKVLSRGRMLQPPALLVNMAESAREGRETARRIRVVAERFLALSPDYLGYIPIDPALPRSVRHQEPLLRMFPLAPAASALQQLAEKLLAEPVPPAPLEVEPDGFFLKVSNGR